VREREQSETRVDDVMVAVKVKVNPSFRRLLSLFTFSANERASERAHMSVNKRDVMKKAERIILLSAQWDGSLADGLTIVSNVRKPS
jgi:hypothetical protein